MKKALELFRSCVSQSPDEPDEDFLERVAESYSQICLTERQIKEKVADVIGEADARKVFDALAVPAACGAVCYALSSKAKEAASAAVASEAKLEEGLKELYELRSMLGSECQSPRAEIDKWRGLLLRARDVCVGSPLWRDINEAIGLN